MAPRRTFLILTLALLLGGGIPALARHEGAACGFPLPEAPVHHKEFIDIGHRFLVRNVRIASHPQGVVAAGEIHNDFKGFFTFALFKVQLFNADCTYLGANNFAVHHFELGITRPFRVIVPRVQLAEVTTYHIEFLP
ncbi:MAG: hypothetical protein ACE5I9_11490 [Candidatus Methylomirabilales bacterium]